MMSEQDLIVLGGGIVGKTAALAFSQQGLRVLHIAPTLESKQAAFGTPPSENEWKSRVYAISSSSESLLRQLQVWDAMPQDRMQAISDMRIFGDSGLPKDQLQFSAFEGAVPQLAWIIESQQIEIAVDMASRFSQSLVRLQTEVLDIQIDQGHTLVKTADGDFKTQLVIAADGANSPTRERFGIEVDIEEYEHSAVIANLACSHSHLQTAYQWFLPGGDVLALLPMPGKRVSVVWSTSHTYASTLLDLAQNDPVEFCAQISQAAQGAVGKELGELSLLSGAKSHPLKKVRAKQMIGPSHDPRIVLLGDAAHVMHPLAGQGLNLGLRDIADLYQVFADKESFRKISDPILLRRYERMRAGDVDALLSVTHHLHQLFLNSTPTMRWLRNTGIRIVNQHQFFKRQLIARALG
jgi:ubiquinone biosynthesis UbiH/UbiF/VisC/COQ6 family hydroxylase